MPNKHIDRITEIGDATEVIKSSALREIMRRRRESLQKEVNRFLREQKFTEAYGALSKLDDLAKTFEMIDKYLIELKKGG